MILTPTEIDAMAVYQETGIPTLALPKGAIELPADVCCLLISSFCRCKITNCLYSQVMPYLEQFDKLILWFASDVNSWQRAKRFAFKLGSERCYVIRLDF